MSVNFSTANAGVLQNPNGHGRNLARPSAGSVAAAILQIAAVEAGALKLDLTRDYCVPAFIAPIPCPIEAF